MKRFNILIVFLFLLQTAMGQDRATEIRSRLLSPNQQSVLVVAHRGDWRNYAENSIEGIEGSIAMGVDIVEIDVARTKDGHLVLMHDKKVDRTTNGQGLVSDFTLEELKALNLKNGLGRSSTEFTVPTLREAMLTAKGKIMVNLDKADQYFVDVYKVLEETGTVEQTIIKSDKPYAQLRQTHGEHLDKMVFMPVVNLDKNIHIDSLKTLLHKRYVSYELVFQEENRELLRLIQKQLKGNSVIWINSLWPSLCAGYCDDKALKNPEAIYGHLIDSLGARIIQTDRPAYLIDYLAKRGLHH